MLISCMSSQSELEICISNMSCCLIFLQKLYLLLKAYDVQAPLNMRKVSESWGSSDRRKEVSEADLIHQCAQILKGGC